MQKPLALHCLLLAALWSCGKAQQQLAVGPCAPGRYLWSGTCQTCRFLNCANDAACADDVGCTACPAAHFLRKTDSGIARCRACSEGGCAEGSCADHVGCTACEEGYFLAKKMLPASGESMQVCNSCARLHCPAGACEDHVGCTSCPMSKRYPNYFLAKHEDAFLAPTVKSCHACSGHFCKRGGCENDVGCTDCPAGFALTRSPEFHSAGTTPLESCRPCKALGCKPSECEEDVGCTACPHGRFLHHDKTLGANVCTSCSALQCPAGDPDSCEDGVGCLYCDSRHYLHYDENPRVNAWRCIKCIDDFNCSKCGKPFFLSTFNNSESTMYCAHCEHKHCKSPSAGDCVARYSAEEYHPQDPQYFPRQAQALTNFGCSACLPGDFAIIRHGVWDCRYNARAHNCGEGAYGSSLHDLSGCRGCPPEHFEGLRLEETISYQPFIERGNPTNLTFVHCRNRCEQFGCKDCDRIYPEGDQLEGVVWKPDGEFWWDSVNTVADVYCYTCLPGKTRTGDGRCVEPCPEADHVRLEDGSCRAASSCKEGMLLNAKGTCVTKCEVGFRLGSDGKCIDVQHPRSRPWADAPAPMQPVWVE